MREIKFYKTESGKCPVDEFLETLTSKQTQKVTWVLQLLEELPSIPSQYLKKLINTDDIWEVRIVVGSDTFRLLGFFDGSQLIVLNHAFQKSHKKHLGKLLKLLRNGNKIILTEERGATNE